MTSSTGPDPRPPATFLTLPDRARKPRRTGITHVLDDGVPLAEARARLDSAAACIDVWKFGWGLAYIDPQLDAKLALLEAAGVRACTGGTLLEIAWLQGATDAFFEWAAAHGFPCVEVSCGTVPMSRDDKDRLIAAAAQHFTVLAEVGAKDPAVPVSPERWAADAAADLAAGASCVVTEGRASGTVGLFDPDGTVRREVVDAVVAAVGVERVLFEAPRRSQQAWLIGLFGSDVNLGNIPVADVLAVETLRLGLRSDTLRTVAVPAEPAGGAQP
ncbi:MAG TPA: phosphosulfolactate synthase [Egibacteraceae bacterium]